MSLCKYKNIFGEINTSVHSYRIFNFAIVYTDGTCNLYNCILYDITSGNTTNYLDNIKSRFNII